MSHANYVPNLGELAGDDAMRDCVHVALAPVVAATRLRPGEHVGLLPDGRADYTDDRIGVVDPFLKCDVREGQRFWLFLYPNSITGLRHLWSHPSFKPKLPERNA